jgi:hypothetical protein
VLPLSFARDLGFTLRRSFERPRYGDDDENDDGITRSIDRYDAREGCADAGRRRVDRWDDDATKRARK